MTLVVQNASYSQDVLAAAEGLVRQADTLADKITILPLEENGQITIPGLLEFMTEHGHNEVFILDQKVQEIEKQAAKTAYGYVFNEGGRKITVIDHHVSDQDFQKLSTGVLVRKFLDQNNSITSLTVPVVITHTDADSVLSAAMLRGLIPAEKIFADAVMSADHTGEANPIADLLQSLEAVPTKNPNQDYKLARSLKALGELILDESFSDRTVGPLYDSRTAARTAWGDRIKKFEILPNGVVYYQFTEQLDHDPEPAFADPFIESSFPKAQVVLIFMNPPHDPDFRQIRARKAPQADDWVSIDDPKLIISEVPGFGGRKDAGSNLRGGVSLTKPAVKIAQAIDENLLYQKFIYCYGQMSGTF